MDPEIARSIGMAGAAAAVSCAALGSAMGTGSAAISAVGAWKKCYAQERQAPFMLTVFIGAPLTQTIYGFILMNYLMGLVQETPSSFAALLGAGIFGGFAMGFSSWFQGRTGGAASDALAETGKGFGYYLMSIGIVETVALFVMVFLMIKVNPGLLTG